MDCKDAEHFIKVQTHFGFRPKMKRRNLWFYFWVLKLSSNAIFPNFKLKVEAPWEWLCLEVLGPMPATRNGHRYIVTLTDLHSKWVEALPMRACVSAQVVRHIVDIVRHFGYPLGVLTRLPRALVQQVSHRPMETTIDRVSYTSWFNNVCTGCFSFICRSTWRWESHSRCRPRCWYSTRRPASWISPHREQWAGGLTIKMKLGFIT